MIRCAVVPRQNSDLSMISTGCDIAFHNRDAIPPSHDGHDWTPSRRDSSSTSLSSQASTGKPGSSPATRCSETSTSEATARFVRQTVLGHRSPILVRMEASPRHHHPGNGGPVAPSRLPLVLASDLQSEDSGWETTDVKGGAGVNLPHGCRELQLGRAAYPRRASHAWFRYLGANHLSLDETSAERLRAS